MKTFKELVTKPINESFEFDSDIFDILSGYSAFPINDANIIDIKPYNFMIVELVNFTYDEEATKKDIQNIVNDMYKELTKLSSVKSVKLEEIVYIDGEEYTYRIMIYLTDLFENVAVALKSLPVTKIKKMKHSIEFQVDSSEWVLPEDTSGWFIEKTLSPKIVSAISDICKTYKLSWSGEEKGFVTIQK